MSVVLYHNPRCSKSRAVQSLLAERGVAHTCVEYLNQPLNDAALNRLLDQLDEPAIALVRASDPLFKALERDAASLSREDIIALLIAQPALMQRPIVVVNDQARIGRPIENIERLLP
ncbi:MAG: ArsC/Spx/MgsR family protein [Pseudomonadota bacterium]